MTFPQFVFDCDYLDLFKYYRSNIQECGSLFCGWIKLWENAAHLLPVNLLDHKYRALDNIISHYIINVSFNRMATEYPIEWKMIKDSPNSYTEIDYYITLHNILVRLIVLKDEFDPTMLYLFNEDYATWAWRNLKTLNKAANNNDVVHMSALVRQIRWHNEIVPLL